VYLSTLWISFVVLQGNNIEPSTKLEYLFCTINVGRCTSPFAELRGSFLDLSVSPRFTRIGHDRDSHRGCDIFVDGTAGR
jgi:hypothetical protein